MEEEEDEGKRGGEEERCDLTHPIVHTCMNCSQTTLHIY